MKTTVKNHESNCSCNPCLCGENCACGTAVK